jgi:beta-phosphoglucomutase-like phosphatase (HAD superfamily)
MALRPGAVIFDLDGTLLDTEPLYTVAAQRVLDEFEAVFSPDLKRRTMGGDATESARIVIEEFSLPLSPQEFLDRRRVHLLELFADVNEIERAGDFVTAIRRQDIPIGLATSSHKPLCDMKLRGRDWAGAFDAIICGDDQRVTKAKPQPDIYLLCAQELGVDPTTCIAFEDSPNGVLAARRAGMAVCALANPHVADEDLHEAHLTFSGYSELEPFVTKWSTKY